MVHGGKEDGGWGHMAHEPWLQKVVVFPLLRNNDLGLSLGKN